VRGGGERSCGNVAQDEDSGHHTDCGIAFTYWSTDAHTVTMIGSQNRWFILFVLLFRVFRSRSKILKTRRDFLSEGQWMNINAHLFDLTCVYSMTMGICQIARVEQGCV
jgi:hypothetical protein